MHVVVMVLFQPGVVCVSLCCISYRAARLYPRRWSLEACAESWRCQGSGGHRQPPRGGHCVDVRRGVDALKPPFGCSLWNMHGSGLLTTKSCHCIVYSLVWSPDESHTQVPPDWRQASDGNSVFSVQSNRPITLPQLRTCMSNLCIVYCALQSYMTFVQTHLTLWQ